VLWLGVLSLGADICSFAFCGALLFLRLVLSLGPETQMSFVPGAKGTANAFATLRDAMVRPTLCQTQK